jgi:hypothetical protein
MKGLLLSTTLAAGFGVFAMAPANAAPIATHGIVAAPASVTDVACRTVKRTVVRNGVRRVTTTKDCGRTTVKRRRVYRNGRYYYEPVSPGVSIGIGIR